MKPTNIPQHVAIILDGNGRWAKKYKQPRSFGHYQGGRNLFKIANKAFESGVRKLTVFAFSTENWKRPEDEVNYLMSKPVEMFKENQDRIDEITYRITFAGFRHRLPKDLLEVIEIIESKTKHHTEHELCVALDYGSKDEIIEAVKQVEGEITKEAIESHLMVKDPVDLLIRTSGEMRLSNFLLWQSAYAEFYFTKVHWPAFSERELHKAFKSYQKRQRRFGGLSA